MSKYTVLSSTTHKDIKVHNTRGIQFGENVNTVPIVADELRAVSLEYPVCALKDPNTGQFGLYALTGFEAGENLFIDENGWNAIYIPMHIRRQPFLMGVRGEDQQTPDNNNTVLSIQLSHPRVTQEGGEALFEENGEASEYLKHMNQLVGKLAQGIHSTIAFIETLLSLGLLEQLKLNVTLAGDQQKSFEGFYSINENKLADLAGEELQQFHEKGYLQACHLMLASFGHIQKLITIKNSLN